MAASSQRLVPQLLLASWQQQLQGALMRGGGSLLGRPNNQLSCLIETKAFSSLLQRKRADVNKMNQKCVSNSGSKITYRIPSPALYPSILELLYTNFFTDEPMSSRLGLVERRAGWRSQILSDYVTTAVGENMSLVALDGDTDQLLGVSINAPASKHEVFQPLETKLSSIAPDDKFRHIMRILHAVNERAPSSFDDLDTDTLFDVKIVSSDKHNRRGGLGTDLLRRSTDLAKVLGFKGCKTEATGLFSRKAFEKIGYVPLAEYEYSEYEDDEGKKIFDNMETHKCVTVLTKDLR